MEILIILGSLAVLAGSYAMVSVKDQSLFNILTPIYLTFVPGYYVLELVHIYFFGLSGSTFAYFFCYSAYALTFLVLALVYCRFPSVSLKLPFNVRHDIKLLPYLFMLGSILVFLPVLIEFSEFILSPREIYIRTRTGYGHLYFVSNALLFIGFALILFKKSQFKFEKSLFFVIATGLCWLHGSKGTAITMIYMAMMYWVYVEGKKAGFWKFLLYAGSFAVALSTMFFFTSAGTEGEKVNLLYNMSTYADYNRHAMMVIDDDPELTWGRLTMETAIYSRIPRVLYPDKPKDWGTFYLAKKYYPNWFEKETGSPSFGILGVPFMDFGYLSILYLVLWSAITGLLLRMFVLRLQRYRSPSDFIIFLFLCNIVVIPSGVGYLLPEHLVLGFLLALLLRFKLRGRRTDMLAGQLTGQPSLSGTLISGKGK